MSLRNDIVSFWFWGYKGDIGIDLQAPLVQLSYIFVIWQWLQTAIIATKLMCAHMYLFKNADSLCVSGLLAQHLHNTFNVPPPPVLPPVDGAER